MLVSTVRDDARKTIYLYEWWVVLHIFVFSKQNQLVNYFFSIYLISLMVIVAISYQRDKNVIFFLINLHNTFNCELSNDN